MSNWETISIVMNTCSAASTSTEKAAHRETSALAEMDREMRSLGDRGWELVGVNSCSETKGYHKTAYDFKRLLS